MIGFGKRKEQINMKNLFKNYLSNLMTFGLERVAAGAAILFCISPRCRKISKSFLRVRNEKTF